MGQSHGISLMNDTYSFAERILSRAETRREWKGVGSIRSKIYVNIIFEGLSAACILFGKAHFRPERETYTVYNTSPYHQPFFINIFH